MRARIAALIGLVSVLALLAVPLGGAAEPIVTITGAPTDPTSDTSATFDFTIDDTGVPVSTVECQLDGGGFQACSSGVSYSSLALGSHTFTVQATNADGSGSASHTWEIVAPPDTDPPETTITGGPSGTTGPNPPDFTFTADEPATFECQLDGGGFSGCSSPYSLPTLATGSHTFDVRATDAASNPDPTPDSRTWTVDADPPDTTITSGPTEGSTTLDSSPTFGFSSTESGTFECSMDGGGFSACSSGYSVALADGAHTFAVRAIDAVGNTDPTPATRSFTVDATGPTTTIDSGPTGPVASGAATFTFSASEGGVTFQCSLDGGAFAGCSSPQNYTVADGSHTFTVHATDGVGNVGPDASRSWTVDATAPETTIDSAPSGLVNVRTASIAFSATESATFECQLDGSGFAACGSPAGYGDLADGTHTFSVRATDGIGNVDASPAQASWTVDATPPVLTLQGPAYRTVEASGPSGATVSYGVTASDSGVPLLPSAVSCSHPSGARYELGQTSVTCTATDAAGNVGSVSFTVDVVDTNPPTISAPNASFTAADASGLAATAPPLARYLAGISATDLVSKPLVDVQAPDQFPIGKTTIVVTAVDAAGNRATRRPVVTILPVGVEAPPVDITPPGPVTGVRAFPGDRRVTLTWRVPAQDVGYVEVVRSTVGVPDSDRRVYRGKKQTAVDTKLVNGVEYRYDLTVFDPSGNASPAVVVTAIPRAQAMKLPKRGAKVTKPPTLVWAAVPGASYYNVQVFRGKAKVLSAWPNSRRLTMRATWKYQGKRYALAPGKYVWYVWPGEGRRVEGKYGPMLGQSFFTVVKKKPKKPKKPDV